MSFMESAEQKYHIHLPEHLRERLGADLAPPSTGFVFLDLIAEEVGHVLLESEQIFVESALREALDRHKRVDREHQRVDQALEKTEQQEAENAQALEASEPSYRAANMYNTLAQRSCLFFSIENSLDPFHSSGF